MKFFRWKQDKEAELDAEIQNYSSSEKDFPEENLFLKNYRSI